MNKTELVDSIAKHADITKKSAGDALEATLQTIAGTLAEGNPVQLIGFGTFDISDRAARDGRNPRTGEVIKIPASKVVKFKAGKELKEKVN